jgi:transposase-like protein
MDREAMLAFFALPAEHWVHLRTTHPIESTFATVRHRTSRTKNEERRPPGWSTSDNDCLRR